MNVKFLCSLLLLFATNLPGAEEATNEIRVEINETAEDPASPTFDIHPKNKTAEDPASPTFDIHPKNNRVRYRLNGLDSKWVENADEMNLMVRF